MNPDAFVLKEGERVDELERNDYGIIQDPKRFCFGMDAVLSGFVRVKEGDLCLDLGTGTGIIPILMEAKTEGSHFTGLEIQEESADMARRSVAGNGLTEKIDIVTGDIKEASEIFGASSFDIVTVNPPYMTGGGGLTGESADKAIARHEVLCTIDDVAGAASRALKSGGHLYMVHRPHRLGDLMHALEAHNLALKRMRMVHPFADREANLVLIDAAKGGRMYVHVEKPLVIYRQAGVYTEEVKALYG